jgi:hypothetical protein
MNSALLASTCKASSRERSVLTLKFVSLSIQHHRVASLYLTFQDFVLTDVRPHCIGVTASLVKASVTFVIGVADITSLADRHCQKKQLSVIVPASKFQKFKQKLSLI